MTAGDLVRGPWADDEWTDPRDPPRPRRATSRTFYNATAMATRVSARTGRDWRDSHSEISFRDVLGSQWTVQVIDGAGATHTFEAPRSVTVKVDGASEVKNLLRGLRFAIDAIARRVGMAA